MHVRNHSLPYRIISLHQHDFNCGRACTLNTCCLTRLVVIPRTVLAAIDEYLHGFRPAEDFRGRIGYRRLNSQSNIFIWSSRRSSCSCRWMYSRISFSSRPTVDTNLDLHRQRHPLPRSPDSDILHRRACARIEPRSDHTGERTNRPVAVGCNPDGFCDNTAKINRGIARITILTRRFCKCVCARQYSPGDAVC